LADLIDRVSAFNPFCLTDIKESWEFSIRVNLWIDFLNRIEKSTSIYLPTIRTVVDWTDFIDLII
jgi:hypothetical protein